MCVLLFLTLIISSMGDQPSFSIDYEGNQFEMNGKPFRYISGALQYFRVPAYYWKDRLLQMKAAGLNAVQTLIPWNYHEQRQGTFDFEGERNLSRFLDTVKEVGLLAILRVGPYTSGEWENGGLPWWLLNVPNIKYRTADPKFLHFVELWYSELFSIIVPHLWKNGGAVGMIQLENEYGSFSACDVVYTAYLRDTVHSYVGYDTVLFTCDGPSLAYLKCGYIPSVYPSIDNYASASAFQAQRTYAPRGPLINSEFYPGWFTAWGANYSSTPIAAILPGMRYMWSVNASWNFYTFIGGTSFGYMAGSGSLPITTSYEFNAPIMEGGDYTPKYFAIREAIRNLTNQTVMPPVPPAPPKKAYGKVVVENVGSVASLLDQISPTMLRRTSMYPLSFEALEFPYGFVLYETSVPLSSRRGPTLRNLTCTAIADRGYVLVNGMYQGFLMRQMGNVRNHSTSITCKAGDKVQIIVENMGRTVDSVPDPKGINANVTLDGTNLTRWTMYPIVLENAFINTQQKMKKKTNDPKTFLNGFSPSIYAGSFSIIDIEDTFFDPYGWGKGQAFINGHNVGRYWPSLGPQVRLYVPRTFLSLENKLVLLELENPGFCDSAQQKCKINFSDKPWLNKTVPSWNPPNSDELKEKPLIY